MKKDHPTAPSQDAKSFLTALTAHDIPAITQFTDRFDIDTQLDPFGATGLMLMASAGDWAIVSLLQEKGADINAQNKCGQTALMISAHSPPGFTAELLSRGANTDKTDLSGDTALIYAAKTGRDDVAAALVKSNADVRIRNRAGKTAQIYAEDAKFKPVTPLSAVRKQRYSNIIDMIKNVAPLPANDATPPAKPRAQQPPRP